MIIIGRTAYDSLDDFRARSLPSDTLGWRTTACGAEVRIADDAIIAHGVFIGHGATVARGATVDHGAFVAAGATVARGAVVTAGATVGEGARVD